MALSFNVDRCMPTEVAGWIDNNGLVRSISVELNGRHLFDVTPDIYRSDLAAAGFGDGKRGFRFSVDGQLDTQAENRIALKFESAIFFQGKISVSSALADMSRRLDASEARVASLVNELKYERRRVDAALFLAEGLTHLREEFLIARATAEYQSVYDLEKPLVSVLITTINRADLLVERALNSVRAQTYENLQIVVVGDHCTDNTAERIEKIGDKRITFANLPKLGPYPRQGVGWIANDRWLVAGCYSANKAYDLARGHFITHLDEDDTYDPTRIEVLVAKIKETRADIVHHSFLREQEDGSWIEQGNGGFEHYEVAHAMVLYHHYFARVRADVYAYRLGEAGDWNRFRKLKMMRPSTVFVPQALTRYYRYPRRGPFVPEPGEEYLD